MRSIALLLAVVSVPTLPALGQFAHRGSLHIDAQINPATPSITLVISRFSSTTTDTNLKISRKGLSDTTWTVLYNSTPVASYTDTSVVAGRIYEYQAEMNNSNADFDGAFGYVATGIQVAPQHSRGRLILVVDSSITGALAPDLEAYRQALIGDGWRVSWIDAPRHVAYPNTTAAPALRGQIKALYDTDPTNFKGVIIIGKVQVPYSGNMNPDGHAEHLGAWPSDIYYGEMNETWTDSTVNSTSATFDGGRNQNTPGDGKFDRNTINNAEMFVGRIDFSNLRDFGNTGLTETDLLRRYLRKK